MRHQARSGHALLPFQIEVLFTFCSGAAVRVKSLERVRSILPRCWFEKDKCRRWHQAMRALAASQNAQQGAPALLSHFQALRTGLE